MTKRHYLRDFVVGIVFLSAILIVAYMTLWLERVPWKQAYALKVRFPAVDNLQRGEPVLLHGLHIGQVEDISYETDSAGNNVLVVLSLEHDLARTLGGRTQFAIRSAGPLGGRLLEITPQEKSEVRDKPKLVWTGESEGDLFKQIGKLADLLSEVFRENRESLKSTVDDLRTVVNRIEKGQGLIGELINNEQLATDGRTLIADAKKFMDDLNNGDGILAALTKDSELRDQVRNIIGDVSKAVSMDAVETGTIAALLHDKSMRDDLRVFVEKAREFSTTVTEGEGALVRLFKDPELGTKVESFVENATGAIDDVHSITQRVRNGEGLLGKLVYDEETWKDIVRILVIARESLEDYREQAPISTFANVLFSAF